MELKCKNCGASLKVNSELAFINCNYCVTNFKLDDEVKHVKIDDMELNGYEFEKGRIRAQRELLSVNRTSSESSIRVVDILIWIFFFPYALLYY